MNINLRFSMTSIFVMVSLFCSGQVTVGAKAGVNFNSFRESATFRNYFDVVPGFNGGIFARYPALSFLTARVELLYMQQGANLIDYRVMSDLYRTKSKAKFHNLEIPLLAEFGLPSLREDALQPKVLLGGFYSHTLVARESYDNHAKISGRSGTTYDGYKNLESQFYRGQYGLIGGLAADVKMFNKPVSIEFRYQYNLNQANKSGTQEDVNLSRTHAQWGKKLLLHTLSINVSVTLANF